MATPEETEESVARTARQKKSSDQTRQDILIAAGRRFGRAGYANVRLKDIAEDVGITAPLVIRYFGSKEALFREVAMDEGGPTIRSADLDGPRDTLGRRLAELCVRYWLDSSANFPSIALIRSLDFEEAKGLFIAEFARRLIRPLTETLGGPDAEIRAKVISAQFMGVGLFGLGLLTDPDSAPPGTAERERLVELVAATFQTSIRCP